MNKKYIYNLSDYLFKFITILLVFTAILHILTSDGRGKEVVIYYIVVWSIRFILKDGFEDGDNNVSK